MGVEAKPLRYGVGCQTMQRYECEETWYIYAAFAAGGDAYNAAFESYEKTGYPHGVFRRRRHNGITSWVLIHAYYKREVN